MSLVGAGNWWDKKDKYSQCPKCDKKGYYNTSLVDKKGQIHKWSSCMFCKETVLKNDRTQVLYRLPAVGEIMNENYEIVKPAKAHGLGCDCRNCTCYKLDLMEELRMEIH